MVLRAAFKTVVPTQTLWYGNRRRGQPSVTQGGRRKRDNPAAVAGATAVSDVLLNYCTSLWLFIRICIYECLTKFRVEHATMARVSECHTE
jgi:hypothetical protein